MLKEKLLLPIKMGEEILTFGHIEIQNKNKTNKQKKKFTTIISYLLKDVDSEKVLVSKNNFSF